MVLLLVEVPHTHLTEVTGVVLVHVGTEVVLTTGKTATTGVLAVLANTTTTGRDVATAVKKILALVLRLIVRAAVAARWQSSKLRPSLERSSHTACGSASSW